jgi:hypothetical protein
MGVFIKFSDRKVFFSKQYLSTVRIFPFPFVLFTGKGAGVDRG